MIVWPTRSRTGSQFVLKLTTALLDAHQIEPQARINGARRDTYHPETKQDMFTVARGWDYLWRNGIVSMKYEDPGKDDFILELAARDPNAQFIASYRPLPLVLHSHHNINTWGHTEADVLFQFSACLPLYEELHRRGRLVMIDVTRPYLFDLQKLADFIHAPPIAAAMEAVRQWQPINTLADQRARPGAGEQPLQKPPRLDRLFEIHPWAYELEHRYRELCRETSQW